MFKLTALGKCCLAGILGFALGITQAVIFWEVEGILAVIPTINVCAGFIIMLAFTVWGFLGYDDPIMVDFPPLKLCREAPLWLLVLLFGSPVVLVIWLAVAWTRDNALKDGVFIEYLTDEEE